MAAIRHSPGPAAAEAFTLGITTAATLGLAGLWLLVWTDVLTLLGAIFVAFFGLPVLLVVVSCLLSVWLGYDKDAVDTALS
ncbi:hypothetical protein [Halococcus saccharolyticus]|uniref:Uncharacterized protein n=1 Tax=Halococcus saccharolyticus DSM 5350 TaxID=1227455 RepID=M0MT41_9EURY|nr:hypothetical protein [Halococcus saccharolyticus]EMA47914.1 hypothetical protein C449_00540 [Halococcus saccharolyticus DSM 5350]